MSYEILSYLSPKKSYQDEHPDCENGLACSVPDIVSLS
jgi:hypothetical protein